MDINSLLSPQDSSATETPPPLAQPVSSLHSPDKRPVHQMSSRTPSGLSQQITSSPQYHQEQVRTPTYPHSPYHPHLATAPSLPSPGITSYPNCRAIHSATSTPPIDARPSLGSPHDAGMTPPYPLHRQGSTPGMDTLADLASMQHQQQAARQSAGGLRDPQVYQASRPSISLQNIPGSISSGSAGEIAMAETPPQPRVFASKALDEQNLEALKELDRALIDNPFDYYTHVSFVTILHQGLQNHLYPDDGSYQDGQAYELLPVLREAYETMDSKYPLGEQLWEFWINDEKSLARNTEQRLSVMELCNKAVQDEPYSCRLWVLYGEYLRYLMSCVKDPNPPEQWSDEDKMIGNEVFTWELLINVWERGADYVKHNVNDSNLVWDRYLQLLEDDLEHTFNPDKARRISAIFDDRLTHPHATWDTTFSNFSSFTSKYNPNNYEDIMAFAVKRTANVKQQYGSRADYEFNLLRAIQQGDKAAEHRALTRYLKWEKKTAGPFSIHLVNALFERATVRFPVDSTLWEDHVEFLLWKNEPSISLLDVLERATRHCPWYGNLWAHRILTLEAENKGFDEIERVKHSATGTGLLDHSNLEELIKVQIAWCGYLRRKAFDDGKASEDDADIAEIGIRSALELVNEIGVKKYGKKYKGDPQYRLQRIHIKFWTQRGSLAEARQIWDSLIEQQKDSYDFWYRYYIWEMVVWSNHAIRDQSNVGQQLLTPAKATEVLEQGMKRLTTIDYPEQLIEMFINHVEQHESVLKVRNALTERRRAEHVVQIRRQKEMEKNAKLNAEVTQSGQAEQTQQSATYNHVGDATGKRKREDVVDGDTSATKKTKQEPDGAALVPAPSVEVPVRSTSEAVSESNKQKRNREHTTIIVKNLPSTASQTRLRQFFTDAGQVKNITVHQEEGGVTANVEFETAEEAEYALTKEAKGFEGHDIQISRGWSTTLFVSNYPPHADESYLRKLFSPFGEIMEMRFPSLKYDTHRRFCYIQYSKADEALAATKLDGTDLEGLEITAKISNPNVKKKREGATAEGREVYVWHLNFKSRQKDIREAFAKFGKIESVRMPTNNMGNNRGFCYIVYDTKENANAAVAEMNGQELKGFELHVQIAEDKKDTGPKVRSTVQNTASPEVRDLTPSQTPEFKPVPVQERSIALLNVPDTINDARIQALVEPYGFKKITLMPQHQGAIVEFINVESMGKASLALEGYEIIEGRYIRIGTVAELKKEKSEFRPSNNFMQPTRVNRPAVKGGRGRGGLGMKRGVGFGGATTSHSISLNSNSDATGEGGPKCKKTNDDFRSLFLKPKEEKKDG